VEMRLQTMPGVVCIYVSLTLNLLHHNNIGITYVGTSNFKIEPIRSIPLYFGAMLKSLITVIEVPFVTTPIHIIVGMRLRPQTPRGPELVRMHEEMLRKVNKFLVNQPLDPKGGSSDPLRPQGPPRYFGLLMVNLGMPPLIPNRLYRWPFNYPEYVKDSDPNAHVRIFKGAIKTNGEIKDAKIINLLSFTLKYIVFDWCNNYMGDYSDCAFAKLKLTFCKKYIKVQNHEQVYL